MPLVGIDGVRLAICRIDRSNDSIKRRLRETQAVERLLGYFGFNPADYAHRPGGSPYIAGNGLYISVSHSLDYAAMVVGDCPAMGVDIEQSRPQQLRRVAARFLGDPERVRFTSDDHLLWAWAAKEAVYKAAGVPGLSGPEIELDMPMGHEARVGAKTYTLSTLFSVDYCCVVAVGSAEGNALSHTEDTESTEAGCDFKQLHNMENNELTREIIGAAIEVHKALGPGLLEKAYQKALSFELRLRGFKVKEEVEVPVKYKGIEIDASFRADIIVEDRIIVELKATEKENPLYSKQLLTYLHFTNKELGLLINFNRPRLSDGIERVINN